MQYQDYYNLIQPINMYGAVKEARQDQLVAQENSLIMEQKKRAEEIARGKYATQALIGFRKLDPSQRAAAWNQYRMKVEQLLPEAKGSLPSVWDENDPVNIQQLDKAIEGLSEQFVPAEQFTLGEGQIRYSGRPGQAPTVIARGGEKPNATFKMVEIKSGDTTFRIPEGTLPSGSILSGQFVQDINNRMRPVPVDEYFAKNPSDYPSTTQVMPGGASSASPQPTINSLATPPAVPMAVPGQTELPPRQFNVPSPTNRAGETNQGYGIDENAMLQQPQIMPSMGNMMLKGAGAVMADEYAPQPRNALVGGMMQPPSQFAELMPAGSAPNRFGSPGVEGMEFAATGGMPKVAITNGQVTYTAPRKPGEAKETFRDMTPAEISASGRDPARFSGQISSLGQKKFEALPSPITAQLEQAQLTEAQMRAEKLKAESEAQKKQAKKDQNDAVSLLRGLARIDKALGALQENPFFDTGTVDQYFMENTDKGKELITANDAILATVKRMFKTPGEGAFSNLDVGLLQAQLPKMSNPMSTNRATFNQIKTDILSLYGVQAAVSNKQERDALPPGTVYVDINTGMRYQKGEK